MDRSVSARIGGARAHAHRDERVVGGRGVHTGETTYVFGITAINAVSPVCFALDPPTLVQTSIATLFRNQPSVDFIHRSSIRLPLVSAFSFSSPRVYGKRCSILDTTCLLTRGFDIFHALEVSKNQYLGLIGFHFSSKICRNLVVVAGDRFRSSGRSLYFFPSV